MTTAAVVVCINIWDAEGVMTCVVVSEACDVTKLVDASSTTESVVSVDIFMTFVDDSASVNSVEPMDVWISVVVSALIGVV